MNFDVEDEPTTPPRPPRGAPEETAPMPEPMRAAVPAPSTRTLPHSVEAEESLLGSCLIDGRDVIPRCLEAHIKPASFYRAVNGVLFGVLLNLYERQQPTDVEVVAEELRSTRQLDAVGGYRFLTQVSSRVPTTAQAGYYIDKVRELHTLREIIRAGTGAVEDCYSFSGDLMQFTDRVRSRVEYALNGTNTAAGLIDGREFDPMAEIPQDRIVWWLGGTPICTAGNLTGMFAQRKAGKSTAVGALLAASMSEGRDCLGFSGRNAEGRALLHYDTEQSKKDWMELLHRARRRAGLERQQMPSWLHSYHLKGMGVRERYEAIRVTVREHARKGPLLGMVIDGLADLVSSVNNEEECIGLVDWLEGIAVEHDIPIVCVVHHNPTVDRFSGPKSRGHLGSQLERKTETNLLLSKEDGVTTICAPENRHAPIYKAAGPKFQWSEVAGMHVSVTSAGAADQKPDAKKKAQFREQFSREEQVSFYPSSTSEGEARAVIFRRAKESATISDRQLERLRLDFLKQGWITQDPENGCYRRTAEGDDWARRKHKDTAPAPAEEQQQVDF